MLKRACGCVQEFQYYQVDKYRAQRQAKFESTRCPACAAKVADAKREVSKGEAFARLPAGARYSLTRAADGSWAGTLEAAGAIVEATADGPQALTAALAQRWANRPQTA
jgi:hypothetical protein